MGLKEIKKAVEGVLTPQPKFYSLDNILSKNAMYNVIYGERSNGKSYAVKKHLLEEAFDKKRYFALLFRHEGDKKVAEIKSYFDDIPIITITDGKYDGIGIRAGEIFFTLEGKKTETAGFIFYLDQEEKYKSGTYNNVFNIVFEEFISRRGYLPGELEKLDSLISTVFRLREDCRVFLLGNLISRVIPYRQGWGLTGIDRQKPGTIDIYKKEFYNAYLGQIVYIDIAVERTPIIGRQGLALSKKGQQSSQGEWEVDEAPKLLGNEIDESDEKYRFVVTYSGFYFLLKLYRHKSNNYFLYCEPKTTDIQPKTRVIGDINSIDNLYTKTFIPLVEKERFVFNLIDQDKIFFSDDLTAADFKNAIKSLKQY